MAFESDAIAGVKALECGFGALCKGAETAGDAIISTGTSDRKLHTESK